MNIFQTAEEMVKCLNEEVQRAGSALKGFSVESNPYAPLEERVPFLLVEGAGSIIIAGGDGYPVEYLHSIEVSVIVRGKEEKIIGARGTAAAAAERGVKLFAEMNDYRMKIAPKEMTAGELMIGSLKCTGLKIVFEVRTLFTE